MDREEPRAQAAALPADRSVSDGLLAVTSLSRAVSGGARVADVGALMWMVVRQVLPCEAMAVFLPDERADNVTVRYAAGIHAGMLRSISRASGTGVAGWVAVNRRPAINADPAMDLGLAAAELTPGLRSCLAMPLIDADGVVAVLSLYRSQRDGFSEDDARLVELLAPRLASSLIGATRLEPRGGRRAFAEARQEQLSSVRLPASGFRFRFQLPASGFTSSPTQFGAAVTILKRPDVSAMNGT